MDCFRVCVAGSLGLFVVNDRNIRNWVIIADDGQWPMFGNSCRGIVAGRNVTFRWWLVSRPITLRGRINLVSRTPFLSRPPQLLSLCPLAFSFPTIRDESPKDRRNESS